MSGKTNYFTGNCSLIFVPDSGNIIVYANTRDLWSHAPLTAALWIIRLILQKYCFEPLGRALKINGGKNKPAPRNDILAAAERAAERAAGADNDSMQCDLLSIAKKADMAERAARAQRSWWSQRRGPPHARRSALASFTESSWNATFSLINCCFGYYVLWDKHWFWDMDQIIINTHTATITSDIWWYYMISSAFYWETTLAYFRSERGVRWRRSWQELAHHLAALGLMLSSWITNLHRIGAIVVVLHDASHFALELAKSARSAGSRAAAPLLTLAAAVFALTRLALLPAWVLLRTTSLAFLCKVPLFHVMNMTLWFLLELSLVWTWMIFQIAYDATLSGQERDDKKSEDEDEDFQLKI